MDTAYKLIKLVPDSVMMQIVSYAPLVLEIATHVQVNTKSKTMDVHHAPTIKLQFVLEMSQQFVPKDSKLMKVNVMLHAEQTHLFKILRNSIT